MATAGRSTSPLPEIWLRYDLKISPFGVSRRTLIAAALDQVEWADKKGFHTVQLPEHHGSEDGYNPSPMILGAAFAARTSRLRLQPCAIILPLHDPVRIAEDACVLDTISDGRLDLTIGAGYVPSEFAMFGVPLAERAGRLDSGLEILRCAFAGEPFDAGGRRGKVAPLPVQPNGPPIYVGGSVLATARRAARFGTGGFYPMEYRADLVDEYLKACADLQKPPRRIIDNTGPQAVFVADDPDKAWAEIGPYALYETTRYAAWAAELGQASPYRSVPTLDALRGNGTYLVVTPEECVTFARAQRDAGRPITLVPMMSGLSPEIGWQTLEIFASKVMPALLADRENIPA